MIVLARPKRQPLSGSYTRNFREGNRVRIRSMFDAPTLSKRQFLRAAGLAIAPGLLTPWTIAAPPEQQKKNAGRHIIIVTFGGGCRYAETFTPEGLVNIPRLATLRPQGYFFKNCINTGVLSHFNATSSVVTGNWQWVNDFGAEYAQ